MIKNRDMIQLNPIAIAATSQQYAVRVVENLCQAFCLTDSVQPQGNVTYSVGNIEVVNGTAYVTIEANGSIVYKPKDSCCARTKLFNESFVVAFVGTGTPTITLTQVAGPQASENVKCCNRAYGWSIVANLTITATF